MASNGGAESLPLRPGATMWQPVHHFSESWRPTVASPAAAGAVDASIAARGRAIRQGSPAAGRRRLRREFMRAVAMGRTPLRLQPGGAFGQCGAGCSPTLMWLNGGRRVGDQPMRPVTTPREAGVLRPQVGRVRAVQGMFVVFRHDQAPSSVWRSGRAVRAAESNLRYGDRIMRLP